MIALILNNTMYTLVYAYVLHSILWWDKHSFVVSCVVLLQTTVVYGLKEFIKIERPYHYGVGHSFPSAYAAMVTFFAVYYLWLIDRHKPKWSVIRYVFLHLVVIGYALGCLISRYIMMYNTSIDIVAGVFVGVLFSVAFVRYQLYYHVEFLKWE